MSQSLPSGAGRGTACPRTETKGRVRHGTERERNAALKALPRDRRPGLPHTEERTQPWPPEDRGADTGGPGRPLTNAFPVLNSVLGRASLNLVIAHTPFPQCPLSSS